MKYCSFCGKQLTDGEECTCPGSQEEKAKSAKKPFALNPKLIKKVAIPVAIVLVLLISGIWFVSYVNSEIDLTDYIVIEKVTGLNGQGVLEYRLDEDSLIADLFGEASDEEITEENLEAIMIENAEKYTEIGNALSCISLSVDKEVGLSNGDKVTVTASFENSGNYKFRYHFKTGSKTHTVSGLQEGKTVDPFAENIVTVSFSGFSGQGEAAYEVLSEGEPYSLFTYSLSKGSELSNGDTVTLSVSFNIATLEKYGYFAPEVTEKSFTVTGLGEYFVFDGEFPADELESLCEKALEYTKEQESESAAGIFTITEQSQIHGAYFLQAKDPSEPHFDYWYGIEVNNAAVIVTSYTVGRPNNDNFTREYWFTWVFPNYSINTDGSLTYPEDDAFGSIFQDMTLDEIEERLDSEYSELTVSKLDIP